MAWTWLEYTSNTEHIPIRHKFNSGEFRVGQHGLPVDGFYRDGNIVFQFHGCFFHGHQCHLTKGKTHNDVNNKSFQELRDETEEKELYILSLGYKLITKRECEWIKDQNENPAINQFVSELNRRNMSQNLPMTEEDIIKSLLSGEFFGFIECDISVPTHLRERFSEMCPIFKNVEVGRESLSEHMRTYAEENHCLNQPQRMLIGSLHGTKLLLLTKMAQWYLEQGLVITRIYQIIQYIPAPCFKKFAVSVTDARRLGDRDPKFSSIAETNKLAGLILTFHLSLS